MNACRIAPLALVLAACLAAAAGPLAQAQTAVSLEAPPPLAAPPEAAAVLSARSPRDVADLRLIQNQLQKILPRILPATVSVEIGRAAGSGVIVNREGLVLTAAHVIGRAGRTAWIELPDGRRLRGRTLGANHNADAGMIQLERPPADLPFAPLAKNLELKAGEWVVTTGQPGGIVSDRAPPVRLGRVLAVVDDTVCTDCKLVGGDSGGPLYNMQGEVVGIHSSIGPLVTHNFHVPVAAFRKSWDRLAKGEVWGGDVETLVGGGRPYIGVSGKTENGRCVISQVYPGLPADAVGIEPGDVILTVNGRAITTFDELSNIVAFKQPGEKLKLMVQRGEVNMEMSVELAAIAEKSPDDE
jgi:serine protease Do